MRLGIGDDAAILAPERNTEWVLSCDTFLEGVHFLAKSYPADSVGYKSLVRAASDLAAMGAKPRLFLLALALPARFTGKWLDEFLRGMARAARLLGMRLAGGDTTKSATVSISITVLGEVARGRSVKRSGARPGDLLYISGRLGRAQLGLEIAKAGGSGALARMFQSQPRLLQPHLYPRIRVELGAWLARHKIASAMMDISDGLSTDLARLCRASGVGAHLWAEQIPCVKLPAARTGLLRKLRLDPLQMALHGGDDYELLFTVPRKKVKRLRSAPGFAEIAAIGEIRRGKGITLVGADGRSKPLEPGGWDPFS
jgi:thiamine-monophosphate kinase